MSAKSKMIEIANTLSYAAKLRFKTGQIHHLRKVCDNGHKSLDVYGVIVKNVDNTYTVYLHAPVCKSNNVMRVTLTADEYKYVRIWQSGDVTHVGNTHLAW